MKQVEKAEAGETAVVETIPSGEGRREGSGVRGEAGGARARTSVDSSVAQVGGAGPSSIVKSISSSFSSRYLFCKEKEGPC